MPYSGNHPRASACFGHAPDGSFRVPQPNGIRGNIGFVVSREWLRPVEPLVPSGSNAGDVCAIRVQLNHCGCWITASVGQTSRRISEGAAAFVARRGECRITTETMAEAYSCRFE